MNRIHTSDSQRFCPPRRAFDSSAWRRPRDCIAADAATFIQRSTNHQSDPELEVTDLLKARVYPNPHQGNFNLQIESPEDGMATIQLFSADGRLITIKQAMLFKGKSNTVAFTNIREAVLFYRVRVGKHSANGKIIGSN